MPPQGEQKRRELELRFGHKSDRGPTRALNEDYAQCFLPADKAQRQAKGAVFLVADGMGGHQAGEVASRQAVEEVIQQYYAGATYPPDQNLVRAFKLANQALYEYAQSDPTKAGMGTTLVAAVILGQKVYVANVGDSRAYLINKQGITQITEDHSWVEQQVRAGFLTPQEAQRHPQRNLITRALGSKPSVEVDLFEGELREGDLLLLCSDGLSGPLSDQQMAHVIQSQPPSQAAAQLVAQAGAQGGEDNATALVVEAVAPRPAAPAAVPQAAELPASADQVPRPLLGAVADWIEGPGLLQIGEKRQPIVVGLAALAFMACLCGAIFAIPAISQRLAGKPVTAPQLAPIHDERLNGNDLGQLATYLGYANVDDLRAAHPGQLDPQQPNVGNLWPFQPGVFLVGPVRNWTCQDQNCTFQLRMADKNYKVSYNRRSPEDNSPDLQGRQVRVFGYQQKEEATVVAQFIERGSHWWAWWQRAWTIVYQIHPWEREVWVYGIVDRSPNGLLEEDDMANVQQGDRVLMWGTWRTGERSTIFSEGEAYRLEGNEYVPLTNEPVPLPQPTVTLMPTRTTSNSQ